MTPKQHDLYQNLRLSSAFEQVEIDDWDADVNYGIPPSIEEMGDLLGAMMARLAAKRQREADALQRKAEWADKQKER